MTLDRDVGRIRAYDGGMGIPDEGMGIMDLVNRSDVLVT